MVEYVEFISTTNPGEVICAPLEDIISIEDLDEVTLMELMTESIEIVSIKDNEEVLRRMVPEAIGIGRPTNHEEFQKGVNLARGVYVDFLSLFFDEKVQDAFLSSLGPLTEYQKGVSYHDKFLEDFIRRSEQEPTKEAPNGHVAAYDLLIQYSEDLIRKGSRLPKILRPFAADVLADTRRDEAEKKRPRPKHPHERAGRKRVYFFRDKALDIAILALVREGWQEVRNEKKIPSNWPYLDREWADSAVFGVAVATGKTFAAVKGATTNYRRQRRSKYQ